MKYIAFFEIKIALKQLSKLSMAFLLLFSIESLGQVQQPPLPACNGNSCNLYCHGDFEGFLPLANAYYPQTGLVNFFSDGCELNGNGTAVLNANTCDVWIDNFDVNNPIQTGVQNQYLCWGSFGRFCEGIYLPLSEGIEPGCSIEMSFQANTRANPILLDIYGSASPPCANIDDDIVCGQPNALCQQLTFHCIQSDILVSQQAGQTIILQPTDPLHPWPQFGEAFGYHPGEASFENISLCWTNNTGVTINFITMLHPSTVSGPRLGIDDLSITKHCSPSLTITSNATNPWCASNGTGTIEYNVCLNAN
jgi:hypothetical protein